MVGDELLLAAVAISLKAVNADLSRSMAVGSQLACTIRSVTAACTPVPDIGQSSAVWPASRGMRSTSSLLRAAGYWLLPRFAAVAWQ